jgi:cytochrome c556
MVSYRAHFPYDKVTAARVRTARWHPVDESQWKAAVETMRKAVRASGAAARARTQEQISEANGQLAESCSGCHWIYQRAQNHCSR